ncbi:unnamed protein product [Zymoseptoria tritici ST99CH_1E4]|uniref:Uncharacterized protein n=1 Tax=Zymoseptoria tritici ST99CH_1E4 TaxID=1276532 RepID=A0A2H1GT49_ZYMTR|nr:unnamed protein product [Zymoseptoria tritici ST99CH_1E4]
MARMWQFSHLTTSLKHISPISHIKIPEQYHKQTPPGKLYIGGLRAFETSPDPIAAAKITHILTVLDFPVTDSPSSLSGYTRLIIDAEDNERQDLLSSFPKTCAFIDQALKEGGNVFVHCALGVSRSASVATAYLMWKFGVGREEALEWVREGRGVGRPNEGFWEQLGRWEEEVKEEREGRGEKKDAKL